MIRYCCGFLFSPDLKRVVLIRKNRPAWQAGKLNGIGGKMEPGDCGEEGAMRREFREEAGVDVPVWRSFAWLAAKDVTYWIAFFRAIAESGAQFASARTMTNEGTVEHWPVARLWGRDDLVGDLRVGFALALSRDIKLPARLEKRFYGTDPVLDSNFASAFPGGEAAHA